MVVGRPETQPLTPVQSRASQRGLACTRLTFVFIFMQMGCVAWFFNLRVEQLIDELNNEETEIKELHAIIDSQADVIQRFNNSITNSDVLEQLTGLETTLHMAEEHMEKELVDTQTEVNKSLNETLLSLNHTVASAKAEIYTEVDRVKDELAVYIRTTQDQFGTENSFMVYQLAGTFTLLSCLITMWHMTSHLRRFKEPIVQRKILAILWMTPIYGITSWLSLVFPQSEGYLAVIKDFYEAYVIYQFLSFCIAVLGRGDRDAVVDILAKQAHHLDPPFQLCRLCCPKVYESEKAMADAVLLQCQTFAMQFVFLRPLTTSATFTCNELEYYGGGTSGSDYRSPQFWITMLQNLSVFIAFSGLLKFYHAVQDELSWCRPFPKFLCIKGIVFMTFWQGLVISVLATTTEIGGTREEVEMWGKQAQNFLICLEMLGFAIAHFYCFPTDEWEPGYRPSVKAGQSFGDNLALGDFLNDLKMIVRQGAGKRSTRKERVKEGRAKDQHTADETDDDSTPETGNDTKNKEDVEDVDETDDAGALDEEAMEDEELTLGVLMATQKLLSNRNVKRSMLAASYSIDRMPSFSDADEERGVRGYTGLQNAFSDSPTHTSEVVDEDDVGETTSLLSPVRFTSNDDTALRPSIFTSMEDGKKTQRSIVFGNDDEDEHEETNLERKWPVHITEPYGEEANTVGTVTNTAKIRKRKKKAHPISSLRSTSASNSHQTADFKEKKSVLGRIGSKTKGDSEKSVQQRSGVVSSAINVSASHTREAERSASGDDDTRITKARHTLRFDTSDTDENISSSYETRVAGISIGIPEVKAKESSLEPSVDLFPSEQDGGIVQDDNKKILHVDVPRSTNVHESNTFSDDDAVIGETGVVDVVADSADVSRTIVHSSSQEEMLTGERSFVRKPERSASGGDDAKDAKAPKTLRTISDTSDPDAKSSSPVSFGNIEPGYIETSLKSSPDPVPSGDDGCEDKGEDNEGENDDTRNIHVDVPGMNLSEYDNTFSDNDALSPSAFVGIGETRIVDIADSTHIAKALARSFSHQKLAAEENPKEFSEQQPNFPADTTDEKNNWNTEHDNRDLAVHESTQALSGIVLSPSVFTKVAVVVDREKGTDFNSENESTVEPSSLPRLKVGEEFGVSSSEPIRCEEHVTIDDDSLQDAGGAGNMHNTDGQSETIKGVVPDSFDPYESEK